MYRCLSSLGILPFVTRPSSFNLSQRFKPASCGFFISVLPCVRACYSKASRSQHRQSTSASPKSIVSIRYEENSTKFRIPVRYNYYIFYHWNFSHQETDWLIFSISALFPRTNLTALEICWKMHLLISKSINAILYWEILIVSYGSTSFSTFAIDSKNEF